MVETRGHLDTVTIDDSTLTLEGWAATVGAVGIDDFRVSCAGTELKKLEVSHDLPSPDIQSIYPSLKGAGRCRFRVSAALNGVQPAQARSSIIALTPLARHEEGGVMIHLAESVLPAPREEHLLTVGGGDCLGISNRLLGLFIQHAGLKPDAHILDVGCGFGRMAYALAHYLAPSARYEGFDTMGHLIEWAQQSISSKFPNFAFQKADLFNKFYNPDGVFKAVDYRFPYTDASFDLVFLTSVFTHIQGAEVRHYLDEIRRVLRPGGKCLATYFMLNKESEKLIRKGKSTRNLVHPLDDCFVVVPEVPENSVGFKEDLLLKWISERGFVLTHKSYGSWCGRPQAADYQDILVHEKPAARPRNSCCGP